MKSAATLVIGLTGGIGSGKSALGEILESFGAHRADADALAREAVAPGSELLEEIFSRFGDDVKTEAGALDRAALGRIMFQQPDVKHWLEGQIHPYVRNRLMQAVAEAHDADAEMIALEVPLLFETGLHQWVSKTILVTAEVDTRVRRVMMRDGLSESDILGRIAAQMTDQEKEALADIVVRNNGTLEELRTTAESVYNQLRNEGR